MSHHTGSQNTEIWASATCTHGSVLAMVTGHRPISQGLVFRWISPPFTSFTAGSALEKEMATHSSVLAWRIPGTEEPGGLPSMGSHRVGHDWSDLAAAAAALVIALPHLLIAFHCLFPAHTSLSFWKVRFHKMWKPSYICVHLLWTPGWERWFIY